MSKLPSDLDEILENTFDGANKDTGWGMRGVLDVAHELVRRVAYSSREDGDIIAIRDARILLSAWESAIAEARKDRTTKSAAAKYEADRAR